MEPMAWVDGQLVPLSAATHSMFDHVTSYGSSVFEGIRAYDELTPDGQPTGRRNVWLLREHIARWRRSAAAYRMTYSYTDDELVAAVLDVLAHNEGQNYIRPVVFRGDGLGVDPTNVPVRVAIGTVTWGKYVSKHLHHDGASALVTSLIRPPTRMFPGFAKGAPGYGAWSQLAKLEANAAECSEGLLQGEDEKGNRYIVDGSGMNLGIVQSGLIYMPNPEQWNILGGLTADWLMHGTIGTDRILVIDRAPTLPDLLGSDEVFLTGTATEVTPVTLVKYRIAEDTLVPQEIGNGHAGPVTIKLAATLQRGSRGQSLVYQKYLTRIPQLTSQGSGSEVRRTSSI